MTLRYQSVLAGFDGNNRKYPTLLTNKLRKAGFVEHSLAKEGPDELRFLCHNSSKIRLLNHNAIDGFEGMHHIQVVKFTYEGSTIGAVFFNSGRGKAAETTAALKRLADAANGLRPDCDYVLVLVVEFGEGDKNPHFESKTLGGLLDKNFKMFSGTHRECVFVSRGSGKKISQYNIIRNTSVRHQSPTRGEAMVVVENLSLLIDVWHSQAGVYNGHRPASVKAALAIGWDNVFNNTRRTIQKWLLRKKI